MMSRYCAFLMNYTFVLSLPYSTLTSFLKLARQFVRVITKDTEPMHTASVQVDVVVIRSSFFFTYTVYCTDACRLG